MTATNRRRRCPRSSCARRPSTGWPARLRTAATLAARESRSRRSFAPRQDDDERTLATLPDAHGRIAALEELEPRLRALRRIALGELGHDQIDLDKLVAGQLVDARRIAPVRDAFGRK